jgi:hypothetical protein
MRVWLAELARRMIAESADVNALPTLIGAAGLPSIMRRRGSIRLEKPENP